MQRRCLRTFATNKQIDLPPRMTPVVLPSTPRGTGTVLPPPFAEQRCRCGYDPAHRRSRSQPADRKPDRDGREWLCGYRREYEAGSRNLTGQNTLRVAAAAMLDSHNHDHDVQEYAEIIIPKISLLCISV